MIFFAGLNFFLAALNVYFGLKGDGNTALNWSVEVLIFGIALILMEFYFKEN